MRLFSAFFWTTTPSVFFQGETPADKSGAGAGSKPVDRGVGARKRAAADTLGGNIINCWVKATGKSVRWPTPYILL